MRARICSAFSCDMFARVVWLRLRRAAKPPTFDLSLAAHTCHAWLARLTRARGGCFLRGRKALLNDFCRAFGHSKARKEKNFLNASLRANAVRPYSRIQIPPTAKRKNIPFIPSTHISHPRPPIFFQRACRLCVHESARLFRVICSHAWYS